MQRLFELSTRVKAISRGKGKEGKRQPRSVTAAAAYRACCGRPQRFQRATGQALRAEFERQARHAQRAEAAEHKIAELKATFRAERECTAGQKRDRDALTERHGQEDRQFRQAVAARHDLDRAAEVTARRQDARGTDRERGRGRGFDPA